MEIKVLGKPKPKFKDVEAGQLFLDEDGALCVKIDNWQLTFIASPCGTICGSSYDGDDYDVDTDGGCIGDMPVQKIFNEKVIESITLR